jgi:hypothetical protein
MWPARKLGPERVRTGKGETPMTEKREHLSGGDRIRFFDHEGKRILLVDLSNCKANAVEEITRRVPDCVTTQPLGSVLILTDFAGASFDKHALMSIKETAVFDKPYVKKSALIGTESLPREFLDEMKGFSRRELPIFSSREEALRWLVADSVSSIRAEYPLKV